MAERETRRTNPMAHVTLALVAFLILFEIFIVSGGLELKAKTVEKYAPWAYAPFLWLVGEQPGLTSRQISTETPVAGEQPKVASVARLATAAIPQPLETNDMGAATNQLIEPTVPLETGAAPVLAPTNSPSTEEVLPVG